MTFRYFVLLTALFPALCSAEKNIGARDAYVACDEQEKVLKMLAIQDEFAPREAHAMLEASDCQVLLNTPISEDFLVVSVTPYDEYTYTVEFQGVDGNTYYISTYVSGKTVKKRELLGL